MWVDYEIHGAPHKNLKFNLNLPVATPSKISPPNYLNRVILMESDFIYNNGI